MKFLKLLPIFFLFFACSKSSDPTPTVSETQLIGKWNYKSTTGSLTIDGKSLPISGINDNGNLIASSNLVFQTNGKGVIDQGTNNQTSFTYKINGNIVTITDSSLGIDIPMNASINNNELTLVADNSALSSYISILKSFGVNITSANQTVVYTKAV